MSFIIHADRAYEVYDVLFAVSSVSCLSGLNDEIEGNRPLRHISYLSSLERSDCPLT
jgi:hypothetical protein